MFQWYLNYFSEKGKRIFEKKKKEKKKWLLLSKVK